jgi:hypothetical protein
MIGDETSGPRWLGSAYDAYALAAEVSGFLGRELPPVCDLDGPARDRIQAAFHAADVATREIRLRLSVSIIDAVSSGPCG